MRREQVKPPNPGQTHYKGDDCPGGHEDVMEPPSMPSTMEQLYQTPQFQDGWIAEVVSEPEDRAVITGWLRAERARVEKLEKALRKLVAETERCDRPGLYGVASYDPVMVEARAVLDSLGDAK